MNSKDRKLKVHDFIHKNVNKDEFDEDFNEGRNVIFELFLRLYDDKRLENLSIEEILAVIANVARYPLVGPDTVDGAESLITELQQYNDNL